MCGIYGILCPQGYLPPDKTLREFSNSLRHRGPDHCGEYRGPNVFIGMRRLAILDPEGGNQPIYSETGNLLIVYNGELYNYRELRSKLKRAGHIFKTDVDTEVILRAYEEYGKDCLSMFSGMFAFVIYDIKKEELFLARDPLGIKPLYYSLDGGRLAFASEAKSLLLLQSSTEPDWTALNEFFIYGYVPSPRSPFKGIAKLSQGHFAYWRKGRWAAHPYFQREASQNHLPAGENLKDKFESLLRSVVEKELIADVPLGVFLSGGLDSATIATFAQQASSQPIKSFGIAFEHQTHDESSDMRLLADHIKLDHHEILFSDNDVVEYLRDVHIILDEPFGDSTVLPLLKLARHTRRELKSVLTGWGSDEFLAGYPTYRAHQYAQFYDKFPSVLRDKIIPYLIDRIPVSTDYLSLEFKAKRFISGAGLPPEIRHMMWMSYFKPAMMAGLLQQHITEQILEPADAELKRFSARLNESDLLNVIMRLDQRFFLEGNGLFQADRMSMAASLEARVPFLNLELIRFMDRLPAKSKMSNRQLKGLLRNVLRPHVPSRICTKPKKGFGPPSSAWLRGVASEIMQRVLSPKRLNEQGVFRAETVVQMIEEHRALKRDHGRTLWALMSFQLWYERYILHESIERHFI